MAKECSFDIVSEIDLQEVDNAVNQAKKEIQQRYDFKGSQSTIVFNRKDTIEVNAASEYQLTAILDILQTRFARRGLDLRFLDSGKPEPAAGGRYRQEHTVRSGISKDDARDLVARIKKMKIKVQAQIQEEQVRVSGKNRDDLQQVIAELKEANLPLPLQYVNYRS